jgi:hypothetical protein
MTEAQRKRSVDLLLACLDPSGRAWEQAIDGPVSGIDWAWVLDRARAHKLIGIVSRLTLDSGIENRLPETVQKDLETERQKGLAHRERAVRTLEETRDLMDGLGCRLFVVKGSVYAHDVYTDPTMRRFSDIDILIPREKLDDADRAFRSSGYYFWADPKIHLDLPRWFRRQAPEGEEPGSQAAAKRILATFHRHHLYVLKEDDPRMHVEVHWHVFVPKQGRVSVQDLWTRARETTLEGIETLTLDWEASLLHAAVHATEAPPTEHRLLHLSDVAWMLGRWGDVIDPKKLHDLARAWRLSGDLTAAVMAVEKVLPMGLPEQAHEIWPHRNPARSILLSAAGYGPWMADQRVDGGRTGRLTQYLWREGLWEIALGRRPTLASARLSRAIRVRFGPSAAGVQAPAGGSE